MAKPVDAIPATLIIIRMKIPSEQAVHEIYVFDIDNTLTPPRERITRDMVEVLGGLPMPFHVNAGSDLNLVRDQLLEPMHEHGYRGTFDGFLCNGTLRYRCTFAATLEVVLIRDFSMREALGEDGWRGLLQTLEALLQSPEFRLPDDVPIVGEHFNDRGAMLNVSPAGRPRQAALTDAARLSRERFVELDHATSYRQRFLEALNTRLDAIPNGHLVEACLGGNTSFDIGVRGNDKGLAIRTLIDEGAEKIVYFGDALFPGGNDEAVMRVVDAWPRDCPIELQPVDGYGQTIREIRRRLAKSGQSPFSTPLS